MLLVVSNSWNLASMMSPDESLWIGYIGAEVPATSCLNPRGVLTQSFIGGREVMSLPGVPFVQTPCCNVCDGQLILIIQLYWPLHNSSYDRIFHVFACRNSSCWNKSESWVVYRSLANDASFSDSNNTQSQSKPMFEVSDWDEPFDIGNEPFSIQPLPDDAANYLPAKLEELSLASNKGSCLQLGVGLNCYMLEYIEASSLTAVSADNTHEMMLYNEYMMAEGVEVNAHGGEDLEETIVFNDEISEKFYMEINMFPAQVIRYQRGGEPLWTCPKFVQDMGSIPNCEACGGKRIFEFQLLPTLVEYLKIVGHKNPAVEFGSVFVFACAANCWEGKDSSKRVECVFVHPDPDVHSLLEMK